MQQNDLAVVRAVKHFFYRRIARHLGIIVPVNVCKAPENGAVACFGGKFQILLGKSALGRAVKFCAAYTYSLAVVLKRFKLGKKRFLVADTGHILVACGVVAYKMPLVLHTANKIGVAARKIFKDKERSRNFLFFHNIKYFLNVAVFVACVKRQIYDFFFVVPGCVLCVGVICAVSLCKREKRVERRLAVIGRVLAVPVICGGLGVGSRLLPCGDIRVSGVRRGDDHR